VVGQDITHEGRTRDHMDTCAVVGGEIGISEERREMQMGELGAMGITGRLMLAVHWLTYTIHSPLRRLLIMLSCLQTPNSWTHIHTLVDHFLYLR